MTTAGRIAVVGDALIDELRDARGVREFVGGSALNVALGLARLGLPTVLLAMVGDDEEGDRIRSSLEDFGVELVASPAPRGTARAISIRSASGEPQYRFDEAARTRRIRFSDAAREHLVGAAARVVSGFPFDDDAQTDDLADALAAGSGMIAVDPNPRAGMLQERDRFRRGFERLAASADLVKIGEDDAALLYEESVDAATARLRDAGARAVLATRGAAGASVSVDGMTLSAPTSAVPGPVVDTMGAGDAVLASAVASLLAEHPVDPEQWRSLLMTAMDVAAATCRFEGALLRLPSALRGLDVDRVGS